MNAPAVSPSRSDPAACPDAPPHAGIRDDASLCPFVFHGSFGGPRGTYSWVSGPRLSPILLGMVRGVVWLAQAPSRHRDRPDCRPPRAVVQIGKQPSAPRNRSLRWATLTGNPSTPNLVSSPDKE